MGKRKAAAKPPPRKRMDKLDTVFSCPFCNHGSSVECRMLVLSSTVLLLIGNAYPFNIVTGLFFSFSDLKNLIGEANCQICQESFSTTANGMYELDTQPQIVPSNVDVDAILNDFQLGKKFHTRHLIGFVPSQPK
uniref:Transcription elongation factor 1 homolog n=1 Tax=Aegilops tauschii subsp. strangulata TaxID=200361 RepID=A0A453A004_AEGTS